jgi:hypothetical protein
MQGYGNTGVKLRGLATDITSTSSVRYTDIKLPTAKKQLGDEYLHFIFL